MGCRGAHHAGLDHDLHHQANKLVDQWMRKGASALANAPVRTDRGREAHGVGLAPGEPLYLLPDMDFGPRDSVFVPFFGVPAATVSSLSRFARLARAQVVPVVCRGSRRRLRDAGAAGLDGFPDRRRRGRYGPDESAPGGLIATMPEQYYWVHKRFKTRPEGEASCTSATVA